MMEMPTNHGKVRIMNNKGLIWITGDNIRENDIEYEQDFRILIQLHFQSPRRLPSSNRRRQLNLYLLMLDRSILSTLA